MSREEFEEEYSHPDAADAYRWYYTGRLDQACSGAPVEQHEAAPAGDAARTLRDLDNWMSNAGYGADHPWRLSIANVFANDTSSKSVEQPEPPVADERAAFDWLETEISGVDCRYRGDPSYDHDAYWIKERALKLVREAASIFTARASSPNAALSSDWKPMPAKLTPKMREAMVTAAREYQGRTGGNSPDAMYEAAFAVVSPNAAGAEGAKPVAWFIDWPDEPDLGHYLGEEPCNGARSRALGFIDAPAHAAEPVAWVRKHPATGQLSGDWLWNDVIEQCRKDSGVWFPLGFLTAPPHPAPASAVDEDAFVVRRLSEALAGVYTTLIGDDKVDADDNLNAIQRVEKAARVLRLEVDLYRAQASASVGLTDALRRAREELSNVEWENDPPARVTELFSTIDALLVGAKHE